MNKIEYYLKRQIHIVGIENPKMGTKIIIYLCILDISWNTKQGINLNFLNIKLNATEILII